MDSGVSTVGGLCAAGYYSSPHCSMDYGTDCCPCPPGTFMAHPNRKMSCQPCTPCRADEEMLTECTQISDRQCQCQSGSYYCDSKNCPESCYKCTRCPGATLRACSATSNAVCAGEPSPEPGSPAWCLAACPWLVALLVVVAVIVIIVFVIVVWCYWKQGVQLAQRVVRYLNPKPAEPASQSLGSVQPQENQLPTGPESGPPDPDAQTPLLKQEEAASARVPGAETRPEPSAHPGEGTELQGVAEGGRAPPEQAPLAPAPAAHRAQAWATAAAALPRLEQQYKQKYFLKDTSCEATNKLYYEFGRQVPKGDWKVLMKSVGLEENDIDICEDRSPGNPTEQRFQMLLRWKDKLGEDASPLRLLAALHALQLHTHLQNVINILFAENILGSYAEAPN